MPDLKIGDRIERVEDERFLRGEGRFVADLRVPFMVEAYILRSPHPHARMAVRSAAAARDLAGVEAVYTDADLPENLPPIPCRIPTHGDLQPYLQHVLAKGVGRYVGEPVAVIVATSRAIAEDAAELVEIDWEPLEPVASAEAGLDPSVASIHPPGNRAGRWGFDLGDVPGALEAAAAIVHGTFSIQRHTAMPLETRGLLAVYDHGRHVLDVHGPTKVPHTNRGILASMLNMAEGAVRMVEPDVGGSFGARGEFYPEDFLIPWAATRLRKPVRWIEDRVEHFAAINHSRESVFEVTAAADRNGVITAFDVKLVADMGAYIRTHGDVVASHAAASFPGPYRVRNYRIDAAIVMTNKTPTGTLRAPGMFEANFARERSVDRLAVKLGLAPDEMRRRNLIPPSAMPWAVGTESVKRPTIFDSGDYPDVFERSLDAAGWGAPQPKSEGQTRRGRGMAVLVEPSGLGPFEGVRVEVDPGGRVHIVSGSSNQGQGHETMLAQIAGEILTLPLDRFLVRHGDTALIPYGGGSYASRTAVLGGSAVHAAASEVRGKALRAAAKKFDVGEQALELVDGQVRLRGSDAPGLPLGALARMLAPGNPELLPPPSETAIPDNRGLAATAYIRGVPGGASSFAVHIADVAVDTETGAVEVERYFVGCDVGRIINPLICEGQIIGGVVQGLGGTFLEQLAYAEDAQLQTGTLADYLLPSVHEAPPVAMLIVEGNRAPGNPLGVKGIGEVGPSGVPAAIGNAIAAALGRDCGLDTLPFTFERVLRAVDAGRTR